MTDPITPPTPPTPPAAPPPAPPKPSVADEDKPMTRKDFASALADFLTTRDNESSGGNSLDIEAAIEKVLAKREAAGKGEDRLKSIEEAVQGLVDGSKRRKKFSLFDFS